VTGNYDKGSRQNALRRTIGIISTAKDTKSQMNSGRASSRGGVEDPLAPQPGPSQPVAGRHKVAPTSKRKAQDEEESQIGNTTKRTKVRDFFWCAMLWYHGLMDALGEWASKQI
jgi:hypothetical protein